MRTLKVTAFALALFLGGLVAVPEAQTTIKRGFNTISGGMLFSPDATYDIGASGATRPKDYYGSGNIVIGGALTAGGSLQAGATNGILFAGRAGLSSPADNVLTPQSNTGTLGIRLQFGLPTVGTCGTSPSVTAGSTDTEGEVNVGTGGTATACGISFNATWASAPRCTAAVNTATPANARAIGVTTTTTAAIFTAATAYAASDKVWWICIGTK